MRACVMLTCFNRKEKTINCIKSLVQGNKCRIDFIVVDDGSSDGTADALEEMGKELYEKDSEHASIEVIGGSGGLYYSGGMRRAMEAAQERFDSALLAEHSAGSNCSGASNDAPDYYVLINDDVEFDAGVLDKLEKYDNVADGYSQNPDVGESADSRACKNPRPVIVGAMRDGDGKCSYGGIKYYSGIHYNQVGPDAADRSCDTFNANFVAVPKEIFSAVPIIDKAYIHSLGDFDYGLQIKKAGYRIEVTDHFVGICNNNPSTGTWNDRSLSRGERIKRKESVKGAPAKQWFYFLKKNFGLGYALLYSATPYIRIMLGR